MYTVAVTVRLSFVVAATVRIADIGKDSLIAKERKNE